MCRPACSCGHLGTCSCVWLPHLENFPFSICPDVLMLCVLGCVGTRSHSLLGHVHPHSCWHTCMLVHTGVTGNASPVPSPPVPVLTLAQTDWRKVPSVPWQGVVILLTCALSASG